MNAQEAMAILDGRARFGQKLGLDTMRGMLAACGDFHTGLRVIHVAGTNGKGSVCAMTASMLTAAGHRTGLYTSPHLVRFSERIQVDGNEIGDEAFARAMERVRPGWDAFPEATYFEVATLAALRHFVDEKVDVAVLEVGLGGRLDATNVFAAPLATAITNVTLEHTEVLGATEEAIAQEKGGIIKPEVPLVTGATGHALATLRAIAAKHTAPLYALGSEIVPMPDTIEAQTQSFDIIGLRERADLHIPFAGAHQVENAAIAITLVDLADAAGLDVPELAIRQGLARAKWPGRLQRIAGEPTILLDGAHNPGGAAALAAYLDAAKMRPVLVLGVLGDKDWATMVQELAPRCRDAVVTRVPSSRAADPQEVARMFSQMGIFGMVVDDPAHALRTAEGIAGADGVVLVTGSLYLVGDILSRLPVATEATPSPKP